MELIDRKTLKSYQPNKRLIERCKKKIEEEQFRDIPVVNGKVTGSSHEFPYIEQRFSVEMEDPLEADKQRRNIDKLNKDIQKAEKDMTYLFVKSSVALNFTRTGTRSTGF